MGHNMDKEIKREEMTKEMTEDERKEELYLIKSFPTWPHFPICPMVNRLKRAPDGIPDVGFLLGAGVMAKKAVIYHENFVNLGRLKEMGVVTVKDFEEKIKRTEYKDFDEMLDNGWRCD